MKTRFHVILIVSVPVFALATHADGNNGLSFDRMIEHNDADSMRTAANALLHEKSDRPLKTQNPSPRQSREVDLPQGVMAHRDIEYATVGNDPLQLDLYLPEKSTQTPALIVWIHGGGWRKGDKTNINRAILGLTGEGYAVASVNYRLGDIGAHPQHIHDCKGALRWLRAHATEYGYDPARIAVAGSSAGGHLALLLGTSTDVAELEGTVGGNLEFAGPAQAIVNFYGPSDFRPLAESSRFQRKHTLRDDQLAGASPMAYVTSDDPPVITFHGDADPTVPVAQGRLVDQRYREAGLVSEIHIIEGAGHGGPRFTDETCRSQIKTFLDLYLGITAKSEELGLTRP